jgi:hypothetical protein
MRTHGRELSSWHLHILTLTLYSRLGSNSAAPSAIRKAPVSQLERIFAITLVDFCLRFLFFTRFNQLQSCCILGVLTSFRQICTLRADCLKNHPSLDSLKKAHAEGTGQDS